MEGRREPDGTPRGSSTTVMVGGRLTFEDCRPSRVGASRCPLPWSFLPGLPTVHHVRARTRARGEVLRTPVDLRDFSLCTGSGKVLSTRVSETQGKVRLGGFPGVSCFPSPESTLGSLLAGTPGRTPPRNVQRDEGTPVPGLRRQWPESGPFSPEVSSHGVCRDQKDDTEGYVERCPSCQTGRPYGGESWVRHWSRPVSDFVKTWLPVLPCPPVPYPVRYLRPSRRRGERVLRRGGSTYGADGVLGFGRQADPDRDRGEVAVAGRRPGLGSHDRDHDCYTPRTSWGCRWYQVQVGPDVVLGAILRPTTGSPRCLP